MMPSSGAVSALHVGPDEIFAGGDLMMKTKKL
jgi:hypothetical protein